MHNESSRATPIVFDGDVVVCGAGPAGIAAAVAAARTGARTALLEVHGCLGGVWTAGALSFIIDASETPLMVELIEALDQRAARAGDSDVSFGYDVEAMKLVLDEMAGEAGVGVQLHTRVVGAVRDAAHRVRLVLTESKSGRQAWAGNVIVDATGDGDVAAHAGCGFDYGHPDTGQTQPMSLMALLTGIRLEDVDRFVAAGIELAVPPGGSASENRYRAGTGRLLEELRRAGREPSYQGPTLLAIHDDLFALMANHEYGASGLDAADITRATMRARAEVHHLVEGLRSLGDPWSGVRVVATGEQIGVREGRRIHGRYRVTVDDLLEGRRHQDAVCRVTTGADVHALSASEGGYLSRATAILHGSDAAMSNVPPVRPYDIPFRSLVARDVDGLLMAGRCISGDFLAHGSYRVTGHAVAMGQAAGVAAALAARTGSLPQEIPWAEVHAAIGALERSVRR